jgi:hypothetical protein
MTTARQIITDALTFHLNRLSPGETLEADTADVCLSALNAFVDEWNVDGYALAEFADLDTEYDLPTGYRYMLAANTAEKAATAMIGGIPPVIASAAFHARRKVSNASASPGIIEVPTPAGGSILEGW